MSVFPLPVHFTENKTDESPNNTGKAKSYPDDGGIRHFLLPENQKTATAEKQEYSQQSLMGLLHGSIDKKYILISLLSFGYDIITSFETTFTLF